MPVTTYNTVVIGGGPAGTGLIINAIRRNILPQLINGGLAIFEASGNFCSGTIGKYIINSDTAASAFTEYMQGFETSVYPTCSNSNISQQFTTGSTSPVPLKKVGKFLRLLGRDFEAYLLKHPNFKLYKKTRVIRVERTADNNFKIYFVHKSAAAFVLARQVVFATGGIQSKTKLLAERIPGNIPLKKYEKKIITASTWLKGGAKKEFERLINLSTDIKIAIIGSSHSAFSCALVLLNLMGAKLQAGSITILYRSKPRLYFASAQEARQANYHDFNDDDICPRTGRVNRLSGLRFQSRQLLMNVWGLGNSCENRVTLTSIQSCVENTKHVFDTANVIIAATGFLPLTIPLFNCDGSFVKLAANYKHPLVNKLGQLIDNRGQVIPNAYGIGLASGFVPYGLMGGEASFTGQTNGLWLYQNDVGAMIVDQLIQ